MNNCGEALVYSNLLTAMDLRAEKLDDQVMLRWSEYIRFKGDLDGYRIYRINNGIRNNIAIKNEGDTIFYDKLSDFSYISNDDRVCYSVEAVEAGNPYVESQFASSDSVCIELEPNIWVPNAFTPDGDLVNDEFFPLMTFTPVEFKLIITNRSGIRLYETNSFPGKWDGTAGGKKLRPDVYLWFLRVKSPGGKIIESS